MNMYIDNGTFSFFIGFDIVDFIYLTNAVRRSEYIQLSTSRPGGLRVIIPTPRREGLGDK